MCNFAILYFQRGFDGLYCRSLGDFDVKSEGLTAEPEVTVTQLDEDDYFLVAASDGLWDKIDNTEAINIINDTGTDPTQKK